MTNTYDRFRRIQKRKSACDFERSAAFIRDGGVSVTVTHIRLNEQKNAGLVFNDKEGPDDVIVFTELFDNKTQEFVKGDYFVWEDTYYLVYEDVKLVNENLNYKKQRAVECNVVFDLKGESLVGAFIGTLRRNINMENLKGSSTIISTESPLLIIPTIEKAIIGEKLSVGGKPWKVTDYDAITNLGIMYLYLEKDVFYEDKETLPTYKDDDAAENDGEENNESILKALTEYTFTTKSGYFAAVPAVEIVRKTKTEVTFMIPFYGQEIMIERKNEENENIQEIYTVVRP